MGVWIAGMSDCPHYWLCVGPFSFEVAHTWTQGLSQSDYFCQAGHHRVQPAQREADEEDPQSNGQE